MEAYSESLSHLNFGYFWNVRKSSQIIYGMFQSIREFLEIGNSVDVAD